MAVKASVLAATARSHDLGCVRPSLEERCGVRSLGVECTRIRTTVSKEGGACGYPERKRVLDDRRNRLLRLSMLRFIVQLALRRERSLRSEVLKAWRWVLAANEQRNHRLKLLEERVARRKARAHGRRRRLLKALGVERRSKHLGYQATNQR